MLTEKQLEIRRQGIGASEAGSVLGVNKYDTALDVYFRKVTPEARDDYEQSEPAYWGNVLESIVADEYTKRTGTKIRRKSTTIYDDRYPFMLCHLDRITVGGDRIIECKTASAYVANEWGEEGTNEIPDSYMIQVHHQMIITGARVADVPVLLGGNTFRIYVVDYDQELADIIIKKESDFWNNHVLKEIPPEPVTIGDLDTLYAQEDGTTAIADDLAIDALIERHDIDARIKLLDDAKEQANVKIKGAMGGASLLTDESGKPLASWTNQITRRLNQKALKTEMPEIAKRFTIPKESRVLRIKRS